MKLTVSQSNLARELSLCKGIADNGGNIPAISAVCLTAEGILALTATDLELSLTSAAIPGDIREPGSILAPAKRLHDIVKALPEGDVKIETTEDHWIHITAGGSKFKIAGLPSTDFPGIPSVSGEAIEIPGDIFLDLISRTEFAITDEDARYYLAGALLVVGTHWAELVSTDGHRLAYARRAFGEEQGSEVARVLVPRKAVRELKRLIDPQGTVNLYLGDHIGFEVDGRTLTAKKIEGQFPDYAKVVDKKGDHVFVVKAEALSAALKRMRLVSSEHSKGVKLSIVEGNLVLDASSADIGSGHEEIPYGGKTSDTEVAFNGEYLLDFCGAAGTEEIRVALGDKETQAVLEPVGSETEHQYVVMPMRL